MPTLEIFEIAALLLKAIKGHLDDYSEFGIQPELQVYVFLSSAEKKWDLTCKILEGGGETWTIRTRMGGKSVTMGTLDTRLKADLVGEIARLIANIYDREVYMLMMMSLKPGEKLRQPVDSKYKFVPNITFTTVEARLTKYVRERFALDPINPHHVKAELVELVLMFRDHELNGKGSVRIPTGPKGTCIVLHEGHYVEEKYTVEEGPSEDDVQPRVEDLLQRLKLSNDKNEALQFMVGNLQHQNGNLQHQNGNLQHQNGNLQNHVKCLQADAEQTKELHGLEMDQALGPDRHQFITCHQKMEDCYYENQEFKQDKVNAEQKVLQLQDQLREKNEENNSLVRDLETVKVKNPFTGDMVPMDEMGRSLVSFHVDFVKMQNQNFNYRKRACVEQDPVPEPTLSKNAGRVQLIYESPRADFTSLRLPYKAPEQKALEQAEQKLQVEYVDRDPSPDPGSF